MTAGRRSLRVIGRSVLAALLLASVLNAGSGADGHQGIAVARPPAVVSVGTLKDRWQRILDDWRRRLPVPGVSAAVQLADGTTWTGVSGRAQLTPMPVAVTPTTPFVIASVTKTFVAATVLQLQEERVLDIDDRLTRFLPGYPGGDAIRLRHLLDHTSGIRDLLDEPIYEQSVLRWPRHTWTWAEIRKPLGAPRWTPGSAWDYSNSNYLLLGRVIEVATGKPVSVEIRRRFLDPLGLDHTWFQGEETVPVAVARGYRRVDGAFRPIGAASSLRPTTSLATFIRSAGAMVSTPRDLATWARALYGGRVLRPASLDEMLTFGPYEYGLGVRRTWMGGRRAMGHGGALHGFETSMWYLPRLHAAVVVAWNRWPLESDGLADRIADELVEALDRDLTPPRLGVPRMRLALGATVPRGRVPVVLTWSASDSQTWVTAIQVRRRVGRGEWRHLPTLSGSARSLRTALRQDRRVVLAIRAIDHAGNATAWLHTPAVVPRIVNDGESPITLSGTWRTRSVVDALDRSVSSSGVGGSQAIVGVAALAVGVVASAGPTRGAIRVLADAGTPEVVDLRSPERRARRLVAIRTWAQEAPRTITLTVLDRPARPRVDLDAYVVLEAG